LHSEKSDGNALFWPQDQREMKGSILLFAQMILKNKMQKKVIHVMATLLEAVVFSCLLKRRAEKSHFRPSFPSNPGSLSCSWMHSRSSRTAAVRELCPSACGHLPGICQLICFNRE